MQLSLNQVLCTTLRMYHITPYRRAGRGNMASGGATKRYQISHVNHNFFPYISRVESVINMDSSNFYIHVLKMSMLNKEFSLHLQGGICDFHGKFQLVSYKLSLPASATEANICYALWCVYTLVMECKT